MKIWLACVTMLVASCDDGSPKTVDGGADASSPPGDDGSLLTDDAGDASMPTSNGPVPSDFLMTAEAQNSISLQWNAVAGATSYNIYRNGAKLASSSTTTYTDNAATGATSDDQSESPITAYAYGVSAVTSAGESAQQTNLTYWIYNTNVTVDSTPYSNSYMGPPGNFSTGNFNGGGTFNDTTGMPVNSPYDIELKANNNFSLASGSNVPQWRLSLAPFKYMTIDVKPVKAEDTTSLTMGIISRVSNEAGGDLYNDTGVDLTTGKYGPTPVVGKWATYKIPLSDLVIGSTTFTGSISGTTLTVTSAPTGVRITQSMLVVGTGIPAGTYIADDNNKGGVGTYMLTGSGVTGALSVKSMTMTGQRYGMYKLGVSQSGGDIYFNNIGWSAE
jgi:hypothetical protein